MKRLVVLTGAGMSAESGISTFRDSGGLWEQYHVEDVATPEGWRKDPALVLNFYNERRKQLLAAQPNEGHRGLAALERYFDVRIVTQNVDNLHERAGPLAVEWVSQADVLVIIGTSMQVYPAAGLIHYAPANAPVYLIDPHEVLDDPHVHFIQKGASEGVKELTEILLQAEASE